MSIDKNFELFCEQLTVSHSTRISISNRYDTIVKRLNQDFWEIESNMEHSLYVGSYGRGTAVEGFSDLDILFILPDNLYHKYNSYQDNGQSVLLQTVKKSLMKTYSKTDIGGDGQVVVIKFSDGMKFEIVPAFKKKDGFNHPDSNNGGSWKITNPKPEIETIKKNNQLTNGNLINLCKMTRAWRNKWNISMGGLLIDTLANSFLMSWEYKDRSYLYYDWMSRDFFAYLSKELDKTSWLSVGSQQYIHKKENCVNKAKKCYELALKAIDYADDENDNLANYLAVEVWKYIYGANFRK